MDDDVFDGVTDAVIDETDLGYIELGRRLERYADARLSPSVAVTTRLRQAVMAVAHRRAALITADASIGAADATTSARAARDSAAVAAAGRAPWRRPLAAMFAGLLTLVILAGTAYSARPGGPLYEARMWTEMANLPTDMLARAQAEAARLDQRIHEAQQASTAGDSNATEAALAAYSVIVVEAAKGIHRDSPASNAISVSVTQHVVVLRLMVDSVPTPARAAAVQALSSSTMVLDDLEGIGSR